MPENPEMAAYFEFVNNEKQTRYSVRIATELLRKFGCSTVNISYLKMLSEKDNPVGFTPEWISDYTSCPIVFRSHKDYHVERDPKLFFPEPNYLLAHKGRRSAGWDKVWDELWTDMCEFNTNRYLAVCFRPKWAEHTLVLHNYVPTLDARNLSGWTMVYRDDDGTHILQYLGDLTKVLLDNWRPNM